MKRLITLTIFVFLLSLLSVAAENSHLKLLAVSELKNSSLQGSIADLYLEMRPGNGQVFIDTYPLSKFDTQLSIRFAKEIACKFAEVDCSMYDFLYTIRADSEYVGGPSAGAAVSVITFAQLKGIGLDEAVAMTGTINSGRIIGNVGGVKEKIQGAADYGLKKVLIPFGEINIPSKQDHAGNDVQANVTLPYANKTINRQVNTTADTSITSIIKEENTITDAVNNDTAVVNNDTATSNNGIVKDADDNVGQDIDESAEEKTINLVEYGRQIGIEVIPVADIEDALFHFTGQDFRKNLGDFNMSTEYITIMKNISEDLCSRTIEIVENIENASFEIDNTTYYNEPINKTFQSGMNLFNQSQDSYHNGSFYSASSQCFGANIKLYYVMLIASNHSDDFYRIKIEMLQKAIDLFLDDVTSMDYNTIAALQTAIVVRQRLEEAQSHLDKASSYFISTIDLPDSQLDESAKDESADNESTEDESADNESIDNRYIENGSIENESIEDELIEQIKHLSALSDESFNIQQREKAIYSTALANERLRTASSWANFFTLPGKEYPMDKASLQASCTNIISIAKSRLQYARLYLPNSFLDQEQKLNDITLSNDPVFCIAEASLIKADINAIISSFGLLQKDIQQMIEVKLIKVAEVLAEETMEDRFPILGYSYYEYSKTLKDLDPASSLLYSEYALELSNLDVYFGQTYSVTTQRTMTPSKANFKTIFFYIFIVVLSLYLGFMTGIRLMTHYYKKYYVCSRKEKRNVQSRKKSRKGKITRKNLVHAKRCNTRK